LLCITCTVITSREKGHISISSDSSNSALISESTLRLCLVLSCLARHAFTLHHVTIDFTGSSYLSMQAKSMCLIPIITLPHMSKPLFLTERFRGDVGDAVSHCSDPPGRYAHQLWPFKFFSLAPACIAGVAYYRLTRTQHISIKWGRSAAGRTLPCK
jgi:hypothetical protein